MILIPIITYLFGIATGIIITISLITPDKYSNRYQPIGNGTKPTIQPPKKP